VGTELFHTVDAKETLPPMPSYMKKCHCIQCLQFIVQSWFQVHFCQLQKQMARLWLVWWKVSVKYNVILSVFLWDLC